MQKNRAIPLSRKPSRLRKHWWERALLYPTVLVALITAGPQWVSQYQNWRHEIPAPHPLTAEDLTRLWEKNLACTSAPFSWIANPSNIKVSTTVCSSGDVFVRATTPTNQEFQYVKWVPLDDVLQSPPAGGGGLIGAAHAATLGPAQVLQPVGMAPPQVQPAVICQRFLSSRYLVKRLRTAAGGCIDQTIDIYRGVASSKAAPCIPRC